MNAKRIGFVGLAVTAAVVVAFLALGKRDPNAAMTVTLQITVSPKEQVPAVISQAGAAKLKYEAGKQAGLNPPSLAQRLSIVSEPGSPVIEVRLGVPTREAGQRFAEAFVETLQARCGPDAELTVTRQSIR